MLSIETPDGWTLYGDNYVFVVPSTEGKTTIKIKQNKNNSENQSEIILPFKVSSSGIPGDDLNWNDPLLVRELSCFLRNPSASPLINQQKVENKRIKTTDINSSTYNLDDLKKYLQNMFTGLPLLPTKINFGNDEDDSVVLNTLHIYDNAESFAALLVADMYLCSNDSYYADDGINIFHVGSNIEDDPSDRAEFDITIQQFGRLTFGEIVNDIFVGSKQNLSDTWSITWAFQVSYASYSETWKTQSDVTGVATGLKNSDWQTDVKPILKVIYGGVVSTWPTSWQ